VKTTIDIPEALYRRAKVKAAQQGTTLKQLVLDALVRSLEPRPTPPRSEEAAFDLNEIGFPVFRRRGKGVVTNELVNQLREQEGI
jgi:hypothetical protein